LVEADRLERDSREELFMPEHLTVTRAAAAGVVGACAVAGATAAARELGVTRIHFPRVLATLVSDERRAPHKAAWAFFIANGAVLALGYRTALRIVGGPASLPLGAAMGLAHGVVAAGSAALLSPLHPRPRQARLASFRRDRPPPRTLALIVGVHVLYGAVLGAIARGRVAGRVGGEYASR
jgi:hypothetical protein